MQNRVSNAANVLIDREPLVDGYGIKWSRVVPGIAVTIEIPRGIDESIHSVALALCIAATLRALHIHERGDLGQRRPALTRELHVIGEDHREIFFWHRNHAAL